MHHPNVRIAHTTAFVNPLVELWLEQDEMGGGGGGEKRGEPIMDTLRKHPIYERVH